MTSPNFKFPIGTMFHATNLHVNFHACAFESKTCSWKLVERIVTTRGSFTMVVLDHIVAGPLGNPSYILLVDETTIVSSSDCLETFVERVRSELRISLPTNPLQQMDIRRVPVL